MRGVVGREVPGIGEVLPSASQRCTSLNFPPTSHAPIRG